MRIIESNLAEYIEDVHISEYGTFYFFKDFIISEIKQGVVYNWDAAQDAIQAAMEHYGENPSVCYISNRVNQYSVNAIDWYKFFKAEKTLNGYAIVSYSEKGWVNALIEKLFFSSKIERFNKLEEAIHWAKEVNMEAKRYRSDNKNHFIL